MGISSCKLELCRKLGALFSIAIRNGDRSCLLAYKSTNAAPVLSISYLSFFFLGTVEERLQRERVRDLSVFERLNGSYGKTSPSLAVKKVISTSFLFIFLACILSRFACSLFLHLFLSELQLWFFHHSSFHAKWQPFSVFFVFCPFVLNFVIFIMSEIFPLMQNAVHPPYLSLVLQNHIHKNHSSFGCAASPSSRRNFELPLKLVGFWWTSFWSGSWLHLW